MNPIPTRTLGTTGLLVSRLGLGLAAVGRPGYINLGRRDDFGAERPIDALHARTMSLLDAAVAAGVRYVDVARSYGRAEAFLADWLATRSPERSTLTIGSKWGYAYTADWQIDAPVHEQKELSHARFATQVAESERLLGRWLDLYQIHSATVESGCLDDDRLLAAMVDGRRRGTYRAIGFTLSGAASRATLDRALTCTVDGERVFDVVHATFNLLEPSLAAGLAAAHASGLGVIAKEVFANGRLSPANHRPEDAALRAACGTAIDQLALAWVLSHPFIDVALSGAASTAQFASHLGALALEVDDGLRAKLAPFTESPTTYWTTRSTLPWA